MARGSGYRLPVDSGAEVEPAVEQGVGLGVESVECLVVLFRVHLWLVAGDKLDSAQVGS